MLFIGTQFSILYNFMYSPAKTATQVEPLGLGAAQDQEEEARRKMAEQRKEALNFEQQKLRHQAI